MGGNIWKTPRLEKSKYIELQKEILDKLSYTYRPFFIPRTFSEKPDFGDEDLLLEFPLITDQYLIDAFKITPQDISLNSSVKSFKYKNFQIDLVHHNKEDLQTAWNYYSYGDLSNLIGVIANKLGLRYTHRGLTCPIKLKKEDVLGDIVISKNIKKIMSFLGLDYTKWKDGFSNELESFQWLTESCYFNKSYFDFAEYNHQNRTRNRKRQMHSRFVEWVKDKEFTNNHEVTDNLSEHIWRACVHFQDMSWLGNAENLMEARIAEINANNKWNANDIIRITGLSNKELGQCIAAWKKNLENGFTCLTINNYQLYILVNKKENIELEFTNCY